MHYARSSGMTSVVKNKSLARPIRHAHSGESKQCTGLLLNIHNHELLYQNPILVEMVERVSRHGLPSANEYFAGAIKHVGQGQGQASFSKILCQVLTGMRVIDLQGHLNMVFLSEHASSSLR